MAILVPAFNEEPVLDRTLAAAAREVGPENVYVAYLESVLFTLSYFGSFRLEQGGRWESPARSSTIQKEAA